MVFRDNFLTTHTGALRDCIGGGRENNMADNPELGNDYDVYNNVFDGMSDDGLQIEGPCVNLREWQNTVRGGFVGIALCPIIVGPAFAIRNTLWNDGRGFKLGDHSSGHIFIEHNTVYSLTSTGLKQTDHGMNNVHAWNNILDVGYYVAEFTSAVSDPHGTEMDYNLVHSRDAKGGTRLYKWYYSTITTLEDLRAWYGQEIHGIYGQADFVNVATGDLRLQPGSLGENAGKLIPGINTFDSPWPFTGTAPDMGAIEYGGVAPPPTADFEASAYSVPALTEVSFTDISTGAIDTWYWDFGDGATSSEKSPSHTFHNEGAYDVLLTVSGPGGESSASVTIEVTGPVVSHE
ncbi:unnamed protein product, partial [marine sediment metagenome]